MTIVVNTEDTRNMTWRTTNRGSTLLKQMGWSEGDAIGKRKHGGSTHALRAVKRKNATLGIGAEQDTTTNVQHSYHHDSFSSVLDTLHQHHGGSTGAGSSSSSSSPSLPLSDDNDGAQKKKKSKNKKKKKQSLTLARNKVTAGHAQKMRKAKCLSTKSKEEMAAIFGTKVAIPPIIESSSSSEKKMMKKK